MHASWVYCAAVVLLAGVVALAALPAPTISIEEAEKFEGQDVRMEGYARDVHTQRDGFGFHLRANGWAVPVSSPQAPPNGAWVEVIGHLASWTGSLVLEADAIVSVAPPEPAEPPWELVLAQPENWANIPIRLAGEVQGDTLHGPGGSVALATTVTEGPATITGALHFDSCLCYRLYPA